MGGRPRIAAEIHKISGAYVKNSQRENKSAPVADGTAPEMPDSLDEVGRKKWAELIGDFTKMGILSSDCREVLREYCEAHSMDVKAMEQIKEHGMLCPNEEGRLFRNPALTDLHKAREQKVRLLAQMGLTPAARSRLVAFKPEADDPFAAWQAEMAAG